jgi:hypothetical protein
MDTEMKSAFDKIAAGLKDAHAFAEGDKSRGRAAPAGARATQLFPPTEIESVFGSLPFAGPPKSVEELSAAALPRRAKRRPISN